MMRTTRSTASKDVSSSFDESTTTRNASSSNEDNICVCGIAPDDIYDLDSLESEWVECAATDCPTKRFHLSCMGLTRPPLDDWFCEDCSPPYTPKRRRLCDPFQTPAERAGSGVHQRTYIDRSRQQNGDHDYNDEDDEVPMHESTNTERLSSSHEQPPKQGPLQPYKPWAMIFHEAISAVTNPEKPTVTCPEIAKKVLEIYPYYQEHPLKNLPQLITNELGKHPDIFKKGRRGRFRQWSNNPGSLLLAMNVPWAPWVVDEDCSATDNMEPDERRHTSRRNRHEQDPRLYKSWTAIIHEVLARFTSADKPVLPYQEIIDNMKILYPIFKDEQYKQMLQKAPRSSLPPSPGANKVFYTTFLQSNGLRAWGIHSGTFVDSSKRKLRTKHRKRPAEDEHISTDRNEDSDIDGARNQVEVVIDNDQEGIDQDNKKGYQLPEENSLIPDDDTAMFAGNRGRYEEQLPAFKPHDTEPATDSPPTLQTPTASSQPSSQANAESGAGGASIEPIHGDNESTSREKDAQSRATMPLADDETCPTSSKGDDGSDGEDTPNVDPVLLRSTAPHVVDNSVGRTPPQQMGTTINYHFHFSLFGRW